MKTSKFRFTKQSLAEIRAPAQGFILVRDDKEKSLEARITPNGNIAFYSRHFVGGRDFRHAIGHYGTITIDEARRKAAENRISHSHGINPGEEKKKLSNRLTFGEGFHEFMERYSKKEKRSWKYDEREINKHVKHWFSRKLGSISKTEVQELIENIAANSGRTQANHILERVRAIYNKLISWGYDGNNPTTGIPKYKMNKRTRFITACELPKFWQELESDSSPHLGDVVKIALFTGARRSNVFAMAWNQIDWQRCVWNIPMTKNGEPHSIPLIPGAITILRRRLSDCTEYQYSTPWVFPSTTGTSGHIEDIRKSWHSLLKRIGMKNFHFHDLRHTFASYQAMNGTSVLILGKGLGHKSHISTQRYAQLSDDPVREAMQSGIQLMITKGITIK
ncbi:MAG: site-specific integrase [Puniceicoccales bacterium]|nr:site-specific integrase [Puniceicoccales bacterium]